MNNLFIEGPIQTGKSTLIREVLQATFGPALEGTEATGSKAVGGFTVQRMNFPTQGNEKRFGFRLMEAPAPIQARTCVVATDEDLINSDGVFKVVSPSGSRVNMDVFETKAVALMQQALDDARAGRVGLVLLDEIGGHELSCSAFCEKLNELLDSPVPCMGVIKHPDSALRMDVSIAEANARLHEKITGPDGEHGEIIYYERGDETVREALEQFAASWI